MLLPSLGAGLTCGLSSGSMPRLLRTFPVALAVFLLATGVKAQAVPDSTGLTLAPPLHGSNASAPATSTTSPAFTGAPASNPDFSGEGPYALAFDWTRDGALTGLFAAVWLSSEAIFKHELSPAVCRWCDGDSLNGLDAWGRGIRAGRGEQTMDALSNVVDFGLLPLAAMGTQAWLAYNDDSSAWITQDAVMVVEATVLALTFNQAVKFTVGRERPFVRDLSPEVRQSLRDPADNNLSFFSGHASFAFAVATAAGTVSQLRGYENSWVVWAVGLPIAATVPLLRMAADRHYLTDVLTGSLVGAAFGVGVPLLLHPRLAGARVQLSAGPGGVSAMGRF